MQKMAPPPHAGHISTRYPGGATHRIVRLSGVGGLMTRAQTMQRMAPPPHVARIRTHFPRGATFIIVGSNHLADMDVCEPNNIENGTSGERGPFPSRGAATDWADWTCE